MGLVWDVSSDLAEPGRGVSSMVLSLAPPPQRVIPNTVTPQKVADTANRGVDKIKNKTIEEFFL